jgi:hypothetical protein
MTTMSKGVAAWDSTPVVNYGVDPRLVHHHCGEERIARHKRLLGIQQYTWNGEFRFWVWEVPFQWRVFVSNVQGVSFEVAVGLSKDAAQAALDDYLTKMQLIDHNCGHLLLCLEKHP